MSVEDVELEAPGPGEVEVRLAASGVCHSDWNVVTGATANPFPTVLGHEGAGIVESVGDGVDSVSEGDHVILSWLPACGRCYYCSRGRQVLCDVAMEDMFRGTLPGGALRLSQNGDAALPLLVPLRVCRALHRPGGMLRPDPRRRAARGGRAGRLRSDDGLRGRGDPRRREGRELDRDLRSGRRRALGDHGRAARRRRRDRRRGSLRLQARDRPASSARRTRSTPAPTMRRPRFAI